MDIEQLKLIIDALNNAGEYSFWLALVWLGSDYFNTFLTFAGLMIATFLTYKAIMMGIASSITHSGVQELSGTIVHDSQSANKAIEIVRNKVKGNY